MHDKHITTLMRIFPGLEQSSLLLLHKMADLKTYATGEVLCRQGEIGDIFYIILEGEVGFTQQLEDGAEQFLGSFSTGDYFGELAVLDQVPRRATATAVTSATLLEISTGCFEQLLKASPAVAHAITRHILSTLRKTDQQTAVLVTERNTALQAANKAREVAERELEIGRSIQSSFFPLALPQFPGWEIACHFQSAREVAGDWYDAFTLSRGKRLALVVADVCDKGVGAALYMALFRSLIRAFAEQHYSTGLLDLITGDVPSDLVGFRGRRGSGALPTTGTTALKSAITLTNNYIATHHGHTNMFATLFFGILDPGTGLLSYINGGHEPPAILGPEGVKMRLKPTGPAVGLLPDMNFQVKEAWLAPGDTLLAFTDGITEAMDNHGHYFGETRLLELLATSPASPSALLAQIMAEVEAFTNSEQQADDITMLAIRRLHQ
jgi:phosphoserine phosphatase RsbU/P